MARSRKVVANNKKARHDYFVEETYEAGIALTGTEIKSVRAGRVSIKESYAHIYNDGLTLIPLNVYINEAGYCKVEIGLCRGKKNYDKRETIAKKEADRKMDRAIKDSLRRRL